SFVGCGDVSRNARSIDSEGEPMPRHRHGEKKAEEKKPGDKKAGDEKREEKKAGLPDEKHNTETYGRIVENRFVRADKAPVSTFSVDVDTASYSNVRRFLTQQKRLPPADAVRVEELINYFPYDYLTAKPDAPVAFTLEIAACPWNAKHQLARIGLAARKLEPGKMPP